MNQYPLVFIDKHVEIRMKKLKFLFTNGNVQSKNLNNLYKLLFKVCLPYNETQFFKLSNILKEFSFASIPIVKKDLFPIVRLGKDVSKKCTNNVYKFDCKDCSATYVGDSKRALITLIEEHKTCEKD